MLLALKIQREYWITNSQEKLRLQRRGIRNLNWKEKLRLLHLVCLDLISAGIGRDQLMNENAEPLTIDAGADASLVSQLAKELLSNSSPFKPSYAAVWQGEVGTAGKRKPDLQGELRNASFTHLGSIEVIRLGEGMRPIKLDFIPFDCIQKLTFEETGLFRTTTISFKDGRPDEHALVPLLYGISWVTPYDYDRDGSYTRFICHLNPPSISFIQLSAGVGHQDFIIEKDKDQHLFGLGSIREVLFSRAKDLE